MKISTKAVVGVVFGCLIGLMCGCPSSSLVNIWHESSFKTPPLSKMLVISVRKDPAKRRIWEDAFVNEFKKHNVAATPSYNFFPDTLPDTSLIMETVKSNGYDGILVILKIATIVDTHFVKGYTTTDLDVSYINYWQRYWPYYREISHPAYIDTQSVDVRTIDVATTGENGHLIWSATSKTPDPGSVTDVQQGIAALVVGNLAQRKMIGSRK